MPEQAKRVRNYSQRDKSVVSYWKHKESGEWYIYFPDGKGDGLCGGLANHKVEEHEDGTISVTPSIQTWSAGESRESGRHGYLIKGIWSEC